MTETASRLLNFGETLPDQFDRISDLFDANLQVIDDVREIYTARAALDREYAGKLQALARKAAERKAKSCAAFVVGAEPTKTWDDGTIKQSSLERAYDSIIESTANSAQDHINYADKITLETIETLRTVGKRNEEAKKKEVLFFQKLLSDRDRVYSDRIKSKQKYDEQCIEVESFRQKQGRANDDRHADRAAKQAEQQRNDMLDAKNAYLMAISVANRCKTRFYDDDVPNLENELQVLHRRLMERFVKIVMHAQEIQLRHLTTLQGRISSAQEKFGEVNVPRDQDLFATYNIRVFAAPSDWNFEPSPIHYDTEAMNIEPAPKVVMQNKLRRSREKLAELMPLIQDKRLELKKLSARISSYCADHLAGDIDDSTDRYLEAEHQLALYVASECILNTEIDSIGQAVGDDEGGHRPHSFKSSSFSIPTPCGYCKSSIWGLSKQGKICKTCGLSVHTKCELKVSAECEKSEDSRTTTLARKGTESSTRGVAGTSLAPSASSFVQSISSEASSEGFASARVLFEYTATSEFELAVQEGESVDILEADDGSGWVKVVDHRGNSGLVPASYVEIVGGGEDEQTTIHDAHSKRARAIYAYTAQGSDELTLQPGDILELSSGPNGGDRYADGWWEGFNTQGTKGIFPSNYVESI
ncbi:hypothetical protein HYPSUDRAFT_38820 [Hypholoma sublateritium FD-334 SS-4]|uniref:FCH-domain-containing protein n=1 Tax=Hypholoma sublateritium (strain FD-334 SS-4) TaxID=945553 RepID=A0A0D2P6T7_HYPSF|nr:hypothetical protein HYPSUDRAFT_38820 [Hypholoma sublateritium FD-334 SS-4]